MNLRAIIFDVDGTLADTERDGHRLAFNAAFAEAGMPWRWDETLYGDLLAVTGGKERMRHFAQRHAPEFLQDTDAAAHIASLHAAKTRHFVALLQDGRIRLRRGVESLIAEARSAGVRLAIATTTTPENVSALLRANLGRDAESWFGVVGAGDIVAAKKPAADIYHWVLQRLGLHAGECIAIEDSANGLASSRAAGIATIVTPNDYTRAEDFAGALAVLPDLGETDLAQLRRLHRSTCTCAA